jgi:hypothetical protein
MPRDKAFCLCVYLFPLVLQLELGLCPDRRHVRSPLGVAVTECICAIIVMRMYVVCGKCAVSRPLFLALYVVGISVSLGGSLIAGGRGGVLTGCWFREQLQCFMYRASGKNGTAVMEVLGEYVIRIN